MHAKFSISDVIMLPLSAAKVARDTLSANEFPAISAAPQEQQSAASQSNQVVLQAMSKQDKNFHLYEGHCMESKSRHLSLGTSGGVQDGVAFGLRLRHPGVFPDFSPYQISYLPIERMDTSSKPLESFNASPFQASSRERIRDYILLKSHLKLQELLFTENILREEIKSDAFSERQALCTSFCEEHSKSTGLTRASSGLLLKEQGRLQRHATQKSDESLEWQAQFLEEGRQAWRSEVKAREENAIKEAERYKRKKAQADQFRGALVFIICRERAEREIIDKEVETTWSELLSNEAKERELAQQLVHERFMNSPEQQALAAERERKALREQKKKSRLEKIHKNKQLRIIERCHHGRNGSSLLESPGPQKFCFRCRIIFDESLGYYVEMDAESTFKNLRQKKAQHSTSTVTKLPRIQKRK